MKIALIGATGHIGHYFLGGVLQRDHATTALVRDPSKLAACDGLCVVQADISDPAQVASAVADHKVVISASNGSWSSADLRARHAAGSQAILDGAKRSGVSHLLILGGAGNLRIAPGQRLVDSPEFPEQWKQGALGVADALDQLHDEQRLNWVFLSLAMLPEPGQYGGRFRLGGDQIPSDVRGESRVSLEDLVVAMLNEAEQPRHHHQRFIVTY